MLKIWKMAAHFRNLYRYNVCLCSSVVLTDVLEHNCNPAGENKLSFVVGTCGFLSLAWIGDSSLLPPELHHGKKSGCWLHVTLTKCGCCSSQKKKFSPSPKKNNFPSRPIKHIAWQEIQPPCFLLTCYVPRPSPSGIRKFWSNNTVQSVSFP